METVTEGGPSNKPFARSTFHGSTKEDDEWDYYVPLPGPLLHRYYSYHILGTAGTTKEFQSDNPRSTKAKAGHTGGIC